MNYEKIHEYCNPLFRIDTVLCRNMLVQHEHVAIASYYTLLTLHYNYNVCLTSSETEMRVLSNNIKVLDLA